MARQDRPRSKAAQETARRRAERAAAQAAPPDEGAPAAQPAEPAYRGGLLTGMRSGFKAVAGQSATRKKNRILDIVLWVAVLAVAAFVFARRF
ncbi:MAG: hypothetical protein R3F60_32645 [bacterium]